MSALRGTQAQTGVMKEGFLKEAVTDGSWSSKDAAEGLSGGPLHLQNFKEGAEVEELTNSVTQPRKGREKLQEMGLERQATALLSSENGDHRLKATLV